MTSKDKNIIPMILCSDNNEVNPSVINELEAMLERARKGRIKSFVAVELSDNHVMRDIMPEGWINDCHTFIGMLADIQYMMLKYQNGDHQ